MIWLNPEDIERVSSEIVACVPADPSTEADGGWILPTDPAQVELFNLVLRKQMHNCTEPGEVGAVPLQERTPHTEQHKHTHQCGKQSHVLSA